MNHDHNNTQKHKHKRHRSISRIKKNFKNLAAVAAGAAILSGAMSAATPAATAQAAADPNAGKTPVTATQQVKDPNQADKPAQQNHDKNEAAKSSAKAPSNYKQELNIVATAYAPGPHDNDQWGNKTFTGEQIRPGIIAVDPSVIPLNSRVFIQYPDGHGEYAMAKDTGGAIKGNRIDVAKWTVGEAQDFGMQHVKVFVLHSDDKA